MPEGLTIIEIPVTTGMNYPAKLRSSLGFLTQAGRLEVRRKTIFGQNFSFQARASSDRKEPEKGTWVWVRITEAEKQLQSRCLVGKSCFWGFSWLEASAWWWEQPIKPWLSAMDVNVKPIRANPRQRWDNIFTNNILVLNGGGSRSFPENQTP